MNCDTLFCSFSGTMESLISLYWMISDHFFGLRLSTKTVKFGTKLIKCGNWHLLVLSLMKKTSLMTSVTCSRKQRNRWKTPVCRYVHFKKYIIKVQIFWEGLQKFGPSSTLFFLRYLVVSNYKWNMAQISDRNIEIVGKH